MSDKTTHLNALALKNQATTQPTINGEIRYVKNTGFRFYQEGTAYTFQTSGGGNTKYNEIVDPDGAGSIQFAGNTGTYTSTTANWGGLTISNTHVNPTSGASLLNLDYTANGDAHGVFIDCTDTAGVDSKFLVGLDGATVITGTATGTDALTLTAGDITMTDGDFTMTEGAALLTLGDLTLAAGDLNMTLGDIDLTSGDIKIGADSKMLTLGVDDDTDSYLKFDGTDLIFFDSNLGAERTLSQLTGAGVYNDILDPDASGTIAFTGFTNDWTFTGAGSFFGITANSVTAGNVFSVTANGLTSGSMVYLESSAAGMAGEYIRCYDGSGDDFVVSANGAVAIAGNAKGTDAITITAGDITLTDGDVTLTDGDVVITEGAITVDTTVDETSYIKRNQATTTGALFELEETNAAADNETLLIDSNATGATGSVVIDHEGTADAIVITSLVAGGSILKATAEAATGTILEAISAASSTVAGATFTSSGTAGTGWLGADGIGQVQITCDGNLAHANASCLLIEYSGTGAATGLGTSLRIVDTGATADSVAVYISAATGEALHIASGTVQIDEDLTLSEDATAVDLFAYSGGAGNYMHWDGSEAELRLAGAAILAVGGTAGGKDGLTIDFDGAEIDFDAVTANDNINFGSDVDTNVIFHATSGAAMTVDHGADTVTISSTATLVCTGNGSGLGLVIPTHADAAPAGAVSGSLYFEQDAKKLWIYNGGAAAWEGVLVA